MAERSGVLPKLAVVFALASVGAAAYYVKHRSSTVHFVNGLDEPVHISVDELDFDLTRGQHVAHELAKGPHQVRVAFASKDPKDAKVIERETIDVPGGFDCAVYNVAGAAPLFRSSVTYTTSTIETKETFNIIGGSRFYTNDHTNYVFTDPPKTISLSKNERQRVNWMVSVPPNADWIDTIIELAKDKQQPLAVEVASRVALLHPDKLDHTSKVIYALGLAGLSDAIGEVARKLVAAAPQSIEAHRFYQSALESEGKRDQLIAEYQRRLESDPQNPEALYLLLRILPRKDRLQRLEQAVAAFPNDAKLHYSLLVSMADSHRLTGLEPLITKLKTMKLEDEYRRVLEESAANLRVEAGQADRALAEIDRKLAGPLLVARLQRLVDPKADVSGAVAGMNEPMRSAIANLYLDGAGASLSAANEPSPARQAFLRMTEAARRSRASTIAAFVNGKVEPTTVSALGRAFHWALLAALAKDGKRAAAEQLAAAAGMTGIDQRAFFAIVLEGKEHPELEEADLESRAALRLALAIHATDPAKQRQLLDAALRDEPIPGPVQLLAKRWF